MGARKLLVGFGSLGVCAAVATDAMCSSSVSRPIRRFFVGGSNAFASGCSEGSGLLTNMSGLNGFILPRDHVVRL